MTDRPPIPELIKRQVRQKCDFGCVFCGVPLYDFEHIVPWAQVRQHDPDNLVLLCPNHHAEVSRGARSKQDVEAASRNPHNLATGKVGHVFHVGQPPLQVVLGTNTFVEVPNILAVDDEPLISVEDLLPDGSEVGLTASVYDRNHRQVLRIERNEWLASVDYWDIQVQGPRLTIRSAPHKIELGIRVDPPSTIVFERGEMYYKGWVMSFSDQTIFYQDRNQLTMTGSTIRRCKTGVALRTS